ncbi:MAG: biotin--[acetyl-CoA-carboxylase] ligase [Okeania sp. SIO3B5]|uniref:biotin--[acetyl-CoA-carboxylase] ligase n=1 Tax=Okeania sp. SIO3B5 TaxID=2607811 RepID=UPI0013FF9774|nr:biotin--[acetyl-CoA-carboxylase] ligase [Okeania sp. SIO3B5]NEO54560.1 biotin--[acetyl-CoA-carboxylase] ligase [Okeania sp. SIO3B5]
MSVAEFNKEKFIDSLSNLQGVSDKLTASTFANLHIFLSLPSTNQTLWQLIDSGNPSSIVIASQQTAGRGQWGRNWQSTVGGLYMSIAIAKSNTIAPNISISQTSQLTLSSAWGIASSLRNYGVPVQVKWPNDLILEHKKLGGILTETRVHKKKISQAVIGVGINWANSVPETGINLQSYYRKQSKPEIFSLEMLAAIVFHGLDSGIKQLLESGIESILPSYQQLLINIGQQVVVEDRIGTIVGVTTNGELRVKFNQDSASLLTQPQISSSEIFLKPGTISLGYGQSLPGSQE